jgi:hypothetical protein
VLIPAIVIAQSARSRSSTGSSGIAPLHFRQRNQRERPPAAVAPFVLLVTVTYPQARPPGRRPPPQPTAQPSVPLGLEVASLRGASSASSHVVPARSSLTFLSLALQAISFLRIREQVAPGAAVPTEYPLGVQRVLPNQDGREVGSRMPHRALLWRTVRVWQVTSW